MRKRCGSRARDSIRLRPPHALRAPCLKWRRGRVWRTQSDTVARTGSARYGSRWRTHRVGCQAKRLFVGVQCANESLVWNGGSDSISPNRIAHIYLYFRALPAWVLAAGGATFVFPLRLLAVPRDTTSSAPHPSTMRRPAPSEPRAKI
ncbi:hypothetical protein A0H81_07027 [Grifola frondosa]|uniref:Uncharacterized protein n=1 Tax=Grifola frondosa TaxID=5627 RepID=A0A1C7M7I7_GRIFR|nr:hypothetical protein A0H81_07027 [Grifola frondosa]